MYGSDVMLSASSPCFLTAPSKTDKRIDGWGEPCRLDAVQSIHRVSKMQKKENLER